MEKVVPRAVLQARPVLSVRLVLLLRVLPARLGLPEPCPEPVAQSGRRQM